MEEPTADSSVTEYPGQWPRVDCPSKPPPTSLFVCVVRWAYGPGWLVKYLISSNSSGSLWILWGQDEVDAGVAWFLEWSDGAPLAWCPREGLSHESAALVLVRAWWRNLRDRKQGRPGSLGEVARLSKEGEIPSEGLLSLEALAQLTEELWPGGATDKTA